MKRSQPLLLLLYFLGSLVASAQVNLSGYVYDAADSTALAGVSIYFDGSSIGTSTGNDGSFSLQLSQLPGSPLVIRLLGYETLLLNVSKDSGRLGAFYIRTKSEELDEVVLEPDPWSRSKKLQIFKREFLGTTKESLKVSIQNDEVLILRYSPSSHTLTAAANEPLLIVNRYLGFEIEYNLVDFYARFRTSGSGLRYTHQVYYAGTSYFRELRKKTRRKFLKNREQSYYGSSLHFMRSLAARKLEENNFRIFHDKFEVPPYRFFELSSAEKGTLVNLTADKISILYKELAQSGLQTTGPFIIDAYGNHSPPDAVSLSGEMSVKRFSHFLPLDYYPEK